MDYLRCFGGYFNELSGMGSFSQDISGDLVVCVFQWTGWFCVVLWSVYVCIVSQDWMAKRMSGFIVFQLTGLFMLVQWRRWFGLFQ